MNIEYVGDSFVINSQTHSVEVAGGLIDIRPKTYELLVFLIEHAEQVVSKQLLLDHIWDDVAVDEHVVVQSIAELRKVFGELKVIQTHPRKGYSWVADVIKRPLVSKTLQSKEPSLVQKQQLTENSDPQASQTSSSQTALPNNKLNGLLLSFVTIVGLITVFAWYWFNSGDDASSKHNESETIYILPTINNMMDSRFAWVSLGVMDALISQAQDPTKVMPVDFVLSSMQLAKMERNYNQQQIGRLFTVTGAKTVVASEISRRLGEYQLVYELHNDTIVNRGVLFDPSLDDLIAQFASVIADVVEVQSTPLVVNKHSFNNEMFVEAITLSKTGKLDAAILLLKSLVAIEPDNFHANRLLIDWLQYQGDFEQALSYSTAVLQLLKSDELSEAGEVQTDKASFYYRHGYALFRLNRLEQAWQYAQLLRQQLAQKNNPFYLGFAGQLEGEILFSQGKTLQAKKALLSSLKQFEQISYSIGLTSVHILLAQVEGQLGNTTLQQQHRQSAQQVVDRYQIHELIKMFRIEL